MAFMIPPPILAGISVLTSQLTDNVHLTASACNAPARFLSAEPFRTFHHQLNLPFLSPLLLRRLDEAFSRCDSQRPSETVSACAVELGTFFPFSRLDTSLNEYFPEISLARRESGYNAVLSDLGVSRDSKVPLQEGKSYFSADHQFVFKRRAG
jgi:hypothetical protein